MRYLKTTLEKILSPDIIINISGSILSSALSLIFFIYLSHQLGPSQFGVFSALIAIMTLLSDVSDFGLSSSILRFIPLERYQSPILQSRFLVLTIIIRLISVSLLSFILLLIFKLIPIFINQNITEYILIITILGGICLSLFNAFITIKQAQKKYLVTSIINSVGNAVRILLALILVTILNKGIIPNLYAYIAGTVVSIIGLVYFLPIRAFFHKPTKSELSDLIGFNKWAALTAIFYAVYSRLDVILTLKFSSSYQAGLYAAASKITFIIPILISSIIVIWGPNLSSSNNKQQAFNHLSRMFKQSLVLITGLIMILPFAREIISLIYGEKFLSATLPLELLIIGWVVYLFYIPITQFITYFFANSRLVSFISFIQFISIIIFDFILIPKEGALGAAISLLVGNVIALSISAVIFFLNLKYSKDLMSLA